MTTIEIIEEVEKQAKHAMVVGYVVRASVLEKAAQRLRELDKPDCLWTYDMDQFMYDTGCGNAWSFSEGLTLAENAITYCPFCGGSIKEST